MKNLSIFLPILFFNLGIAWAGDELNACREMCFHTVLNQRTCLAECAEQEVSCGKNEYLDPRTSSCISITDADCESGYTYDRQSHTCKVVSLESDNKCITKAQKESEDCAVAAAVYDNSPQSPGEQSCKPNERWDLGVEKCVPKDQPPTQAEEKANACPAAHEEVVSSCDSEAGGWINSFSKVTQGVGPTLLQMDSSMCSGIAAAEIGAKTSLVAFKSMCNSAMNKCLDACTGTDEESLINAKDCRARGDSAKVVQQSMVAAMNTLQTQVAQCQTAFGDTSQQAQAVCATDPAACQFKTAALQTNAIPSDQAGGAAAQLATPGVGGKTGNAASGFNASDFNDGEGFALGDIKPSKPGEEIGGAKGGSGASAGGSPTAGGGGGSGGGKKEGGLLSNILSGFFGSGGGSGGFGGGLRNLFGGNKGDAYADPNTKKIAKGPDLRQFLPGGLRDPLKNRGIAGQIVGQDGMTGPHSDIWKQINNRYQAKRASLIP
jgi:hypothetical protein